MEFAKYYEVTGLVKKNLEEWNLYSYRDNTIEKIFICMDVHDFWIARIYKDLNDDFEFEEGRYLIEREKINKYDLIEFIEEDKNVDYEVTNRRDRDRVLAAMDDNEIKKYLLKMSDDSGLEGWDNFEANSLEKAIDILDDGYGIIMEGVN